MLKLLAVFLFMIPLSGCLVTSAVGTAVDVTGAVVGATVGTAGAIVDAAVPGDDDDEDDDD